MQIDKALIEKFLDNRCDSEEAQQVAAFLQQHPEILQQYYAQDWKGSEQGEPLNRRVSEAIWQTIEKQAGLRKVRLLHYWPSVAAAAVVILVAGLWWWPKNERVAPAVPVAMVPVTDSIAKKDMQWHTEYNAGNRKIKLQLPDGSYTSLSPCTEIRYPVPFPSGKREIYLKGQALFEVAKDRSRPFTVYTGVLATTALGTAFEITETADIIDVKLHHGKVVIRPVQQHLKGWKKDVFLLPGMQLHYDAGTSVVKVSAKDRTSAIAAGAASKENNENKLVFDNTPMPQVMKALMDQYQVSIDYDHSALKDLHFSGVVYHSDSLPVLLQVIGRMNNLSVTSGPGGFRLKRMTPE